MSLLDPIVDLILGYSDIDFEKIIKRSGKKPTAAETAPRRRIAPTRPKTALPRRPPDS